MPEKQPNAVDLKPVESSIEVWASVQGYETLYEISDHARIRRIGQASGAQVGKILAVQESNKWSAYPTVTLSKNGVSKSYYVHQLVLEAFVGPRPPGMETLHANDIKTDNRLSNLSWGTPSENGYDKVRNGRHHGANKTHCKCGEPLVFYNKQRLCMTCLRRSQRDYMRRRRAAERKASQ